MASTGVATMPKKAPTNAGNSKAELARARKSAVADVKKALVEKAAEDAKWADEGPKQTKAMQKKMLSEESKAMTAERKAEDKALAKKEAEEIASTLKAGGGKKKGGKGDRPGKMTAAMIALAKAEREAREEKLRAKRQREASKVVEEADYTSLVDKQNRNLELNDDAAATSIEGALALVGGDAARLQAMAAASGSLRDQNQAAKGKMTYKLFESTRLPQLKEEKPGLLGSQYRDLARKEWKRSPMNPNNQ